MDHYRKVSSKYVEDAILPNEIRVAPSTKQNDVINTIVDMLNTECRTSGVIVSGSGDDCTKVVTIVEQMKKKIVQTMTQSAMIKYSKIQDLWKADTEGLDKHILEKFSLKVTRHIPVLSIRVMVSEPVSFKTQSQNKPRTRHTHSRSHNQKQKTRTS